MAIEVTNTLNIWLPLITGATGLVSGIVLEWYRDKRTYNRELEARGAIRRDAQAERRNEFQRQTLLDLQEAANALVEITSDINLFRLMSCMETGKLQIAQPPDTIKNFSMADARLAMLSVRIVDNPVRHLVKQLQAANMTAVFTNSPDPFDPIRNGMMTSFRELNDRIGEILRSIDEVEVA